MRNALLAAASLSLAALLPLSALAATNEEKDDDTIKRKIKVVNVTATGGFLGVGVADVDQDRAKELGLREEYGVEVNSVVKDSTAAKAGVKKGDVVLEYNGTKVESTAQFIRMVRETPPGRQVKLQVFRDGHTMSLTGQMEKRQPQVFHWKSGKDGGEGEGVYGLAVPDQEMMYFDNDFDIDIPDIDIHIPDIPTPQMSWRTPRLGVETEGLGPQLAEFFGVKDGVLVRSVIKDSAAEKAGLKAGDVIVKIGGQEVSRSGDISSFLRTSDAQDLPIVVMRNRREVTLTAKLEPRVNGQALPKKRSSYYMERMGPEWEHPEWKYPEWEHEEEEEEESEDL